MKVARSDAAPRPPGPPSEVSGGDPVATRVLGVDGCHGGWLALALEAEFSVGAVPEPTLVRRWRDLPLGTVALVAVDMPIGLAERGPRACDIAARERLPRGRKSSVFAPPRRAMLACPDWAAANALGRAREGVGLSKQAWNLAPKIRELDRAVSPADQTRIREVHPELVFLRLAGGAPLPRKASADGRRIRRRLLEAAGLRGFDALLAALPRDRARPDDLFDAAACALAARDLLHGRGTRLPPGPEPERDARGLAMEIWF